jgi:hypothetical protein
MTFPTITPPRPSLLPLASARGCVNPSRAVPGHSKYVAGLSRLDAAVHGIISERRENGVLEGDTDFLAFLMRAQAASGGVFPTDKQIRDEVSGVAYASTDYFSIYRSAFCAHRITRWRVC